MEVDRPWVVSAVKSGATSLIRRDIFFSSSSFVSFQIHFAQTKTHPAHQLWVGLAEIESKVACYDSPMRAPTFPDSNSSRAWASHSVSSSWLDLFAPQLEQLASVHVPDAVYLKTYVRGVLMSTASVTRTFDYAQVDVFAERPRTRNQDASSQPNLCPGSPLRTQCQKSTRRWPHHSHCKWTHFPAVIHPISTETRRKRPTATHSLKIR
jgi:hypothetical protein